MTAAGRRAVPLAVALLLAAAQLPPSATAGDVAAAPPATPAEPVLDVYHGTEVRDPYRWLEDWNEPRVQAWSAAQNAQARAWLDALPGLAAVRARVTELRRQAVPAYYGLEWAGGRLFALKHQPPKQQSFLVVMASEDAPAAERVLVDPVALDPAGGTSIDWFEPSLDGRRIAVSLSRGGSERGDLHVFDVDSGKPVGEIVPRVNYGTALGSAAFDATGEGIFYTRYPRPGERPDADLDFYVQVHYHRFGTPSATDRYEIGKDFPRIAEIFLSTSPDGRFLLANVANGDGGEYAQHVRRPDGRWVQLSAFTDKLVTPAFGPGGELYAVARQGAPRGRLVRLEPAGFAPGALARAPTLVAAGEAVLDFVVPTGRHLVVRETVGGPQRARVLDRDGRELAVLPTPAVSAVQGLTWLEGRPGDLLLFATSSHVESLAWQRVDLAARPLVAGRVALTHPSPVDFADVEVMRETAVSKDGTRVPLTILARRGTPRDGRNPTLLYGYGGYGISLTPRFDAGLRLWLDRGGVWAMANLRGGGELGEEWHEAGKLTRKQNVFDDFVACAERLIELKLTASERLAIEGGSNGGLLMGAALTQRPDLFRAVVSHVGIYDMLRVERSPNGAFNVPEFGTVTDPEQFRALYAYSPYHHVEDGRRYPDVLFLTGANDPRVDPMHSRKMTARLQAATGGRSLVLLRTSASTGHGAGTPLDARIEQETDVWAFLLDRLRVAPPPGS